MTITTIRYTGHRGAMGYVAENTLLSFERAVADGVDDVELDLRLSKDGVMVIMHDAAVDRTTDGHGAVADLTLAELRRLDAGDGQRIPTFEEALDSVTVRILAEIKSADVVEPLIRLLAARPELRDRVDVIGFDPDVVSAVIAAFPEMRTALLSVVASTELVDRAAQLGATWVGVGWEGSTRSLVDYTHSLGLEYSLWPAPTHDDIDRAISLGADAVTTDYPRLIGERPGRE